MDNSAHWFWLPQGFDICQSLPSRLHRLADEGRWVVSTISQKMAYRQVDEFGYARLHWPILHRILTQNHWSELKEVLVEDGVIEIDPYVREHRSTGYRLGECWLSRRLVRCRAVNPLLLAKLNKERARLEEEQRKRRLPIHHALDQAQRWLTITDDADSVLDTLKPRAKFGQDALVENLRRSESHFSVGSTGRCFNNITGLKRELRGALRIAGKPVGDVDLRCAQPALLALLIGWSSPSAGLKIAEAYKLESVLGRLFSLFSASFAGAPSVDCSEAGRFAFLVCSGFFYDNVDVFCGLHRDVVKKNFLVDVLAKRGCYHSDVESAFREAFPTIFAFIRWINRNDHGLLIRLLQKLESWLVIETVAPRLVDLVPIATLHDAIFCRQHDVGLVATTFQEVLGEIGFRMQTKQQYWN